MAFNYSPKIVTDGLVLYLDAANQYSYVSGSTSWNDISRGGNNGTLVNGPTYNSANGGSIVFDGVDDYINCGNSLNLQITTGTLSAWVKATSSVNGIYRAIICKQLAWGLFVLDNILVTYDWGNVASRPTTITVGNSIWCNVCMSFTETTGTPSNNATIYVNGLPVLTTTIKNVNQNINCFIGYGNSSNQYVIGNIASTQIYNRALSATEVLQNYNATKTRFGL
jgi:hypothetical protein